MQPVMENKCVTILNLIYKTGIDDILQSRPWIFGTAVPNNRA